MLKDFNNADFEYITAASAGRMLGENSYTYVVTENKIRVRRVIKVFKNLRPSLIFMVHGSKQVLMIHSPEKILG